MENGGSYMASHLPSHNINIYFIGALFGSYKSITAAHLGYHINCSAYYGVFIDPQLAKTFTKLVN
ncbi:MAG: hypothetical protein H7141_06685 [Burkholderiales bacterium]|nr:hypothetical protein [Bacteroidia bacterium]